MRPLAPVLVLGAAAAALQGCGGERPEGPSVVLVIVDTLRADRLGCYGGPEDVSPELDALASESIVFEAAHCTARHAIGNSSGFRRPV